MFGSHRAKISIIKFFYIRDDRCENFLQLRQFLPLGGDGLDILGWVVGWILGADH